MARSTPRAIRSGLSHVDPMGKLHMVDVGDKPVTRRSAVAAAKVRISTALARAIQANTLAKGDLLAVARMAGIQAAKRTAELIPLCHPLLLQFVDVRVALRGRTIHIRSQVVSQGQTGAEMEALTAVSVAALTVIDMGKSVDRSMVIQDIHLLEKTGGIRGDYRAPRVSRRNVR